MLHSASTTSYITVINLEILALCHLFPACNLLASASIAVFSLINPIPTALFANAMLL